MEEDEDEDVVDVTKPPKLKVMVPEGLDIVEAVSMTRLSSSVAVADAMVLGVEVAVCELAWLSASEPESCPFPFWAVVVVLLVVLLVLVVLGLMVVETSLRVVSASVEILPAVEVTDVVELSVVVATGAGWALVGIWSVVCSGGPWLEADGRFVGWSVASVVERLEAGVAMTSGSGSTVDEIPG